MSHDRSELDGAEDLDTPPIELRAVHERLQRDGASWRAQLPSSERLASRMRALVETSAATTTRERTQRPPAPAPVSLSDGRATATRGRMARWTAAAAVAAVVILMATVLHSVAGGQATRLRATPTATAATATATTAPAAWETIGGLADQSALPILAPSDPRVAYEAGAVVSGVSIPLRRTDDAGASWVTLPVPQSNGASLVGLTVQVSPLDARTVFLQGGIAIPVFTPTSCDHLALSAMGKDRWDSATGPSGECLVDFYSADGGEHWRQLHFPIPGTLFEVPAYSWPIYRYDQDTPQAQGGRLYASLHSAAAVGN
jgi:hypothetical protein